MTVADRQPRRQRRGEYLSRPGVVIGDGAAGSAAGDGSAGLCGGLFLPGSGGDAGHSDRHRDEPAGCGPRSPRAPARWRRLGRHGEERLRMTSATPINDEDLVAYLDAALPPARRAAVDAALAQDPALRDQLDGLRIDVPAIRAAFDAHA